MDEALILEILDDWNLWKEGIQTGVSRDLYTKRLLAYLPSKMVLAVVGARRAGKSFIIKQVASKLADRVGKENILIVNFEDSRFPQLKDSNLAAIFETYKKTLDPTSTPYIFLDEVQRVRGWERWVRTINELGKAYVVVSGSTSKLISDDLATLLTGRHIDTEVFPLNFIELLKFNGVEIGGALDSIRKKSTVMRFLEQYMEFGGFPEVALSKNKKEILLTYFEDIVTKDIIQRYKVRKPNSLLALARFYLTNISSPITFNSIKQFVNLSVDTIDLFTSYLESSYIIFLLKRFSWSVKDQEKSPRKVYSMDTGLSNSVGYRFSDDRGKVLENVVAIELKRRQSDNSHLDVMYWKDTRGREVDFVLKVGKHVEQLVQVSYVNDRVAVKDREIAALLAASKDTRCNKLLVITWQYEGLEKRGGKNIAFVPLWKWLLEKGKK